MFTQDFLTQISTRIEEVERKSSVELVVVLSPSSGSYRELEGQCGFALVVILLIVAIYSPWTFLPEYLLGGVVVAYLSGYVLSVKAGWLRRLLTSVQRRRRQVESQANDAFVRKQVSHTRERTGLLLYVSEFERLVKFVPDTGIQGKVPTAIFNELESRWSQVSSLSELEKAILEGLGPLGDILGESLPRAADDQDELPNEIWFMKAGV